MRWHTSLPSWSLSCAPSSSSSSPIRHRENRGPFRVLFPYGGLFRAVSGSFHMGGSFRAVSSSFPLWLLFQAVSATVSDGSGCFGLVSKEVVFQPRFQKAVDVSRSVSEWKVVKKYDLITKITFEVQSARLELAFADTHISALTTDLLWQPIGSAYNLWVAC